MRSEAKGNNNFSVVFAQLLLFYIIIHSCFILHASITVAVKCSSPIVCTRVLSAEPDCKFQKAHVSSSSFVSLHTASLAQGTS